MGVIFVLENRPMSTETQGPVSVSSRRLLRSICKVLSFGSFVALNRVKHFPAVNRYLLGRFYPEAYFVDSNFYNNDRNVVVDDDTFVLFATKNKHLAPPMSEEYVGRARRATLHTCGE